MVSGEDVPNKTNPMTPIIAPTAFTRPARPPISRRPGGFCHDRWPMPVPWKTPFDPPKLRIFTIKWWFLPGFSNQMMDFRGFSQPNDGFCQQHLDMLATSSWISSQNGWIWAARMVEFHSRAAFWNRLEKHRETLWDFLMKPDQTLYHGMGDMDWQQSLMQPPLRRETLWDFMQSHQTGHCIALYSHVFSAVFSIS